LNQELVEWYKVRHNKFDGENTPNPHSLRFLNQLAIDILHPISDALGSIRITYGFTSHPLLLYIQKNSPGHMAPALDQHAAMELNSRGNRVCKNDGASCDFLVDGYESRMKEVAQYIAANLPFDGLYYYGDDKPLHVSVGPENRRMVILMNTGEDGVRRPGRKAFGDAAVSLFSDER